MASTNLKESGVTGHPFFDPELDLPGAKPKSGGDSYLSTAGQNEPDPNAQRERAWPNGEGTFWFLGAALGATVVTPDIVQLRAALGETTHTPEPETLEAIYAKLQELPASAEHSFGGPLHLSDPTSPAQKPDSTPEAIPELPRRTPGGTLTGMKPVAFEPAAGLTSQAPTPPALLLPPAEN